MSRMDELRLMTKIARMYYSQNIRQQDITAKLGVHQSTVSRMLKRAREANIVRISVVAPSGIYSDLEEALEKQFGLHEAIVIEAPDVDRGEGAYRELGAAAAFFVETNVKPGSIVGISSWSRALGAMVSAMSQSACGRGGKVVQILGGVGTASAQMHATHLAHELAMRIGATPVMLQAPAVAGSEAARRAFAADPAVLEASNLFSRVDVALVGIGSLEPSSLLARSGNIFSREERAELGERGAVGDVCLRFLDQEGVPVSSPLLDRVIGIDLASLRKAKRVVAVAAGSRKLAAIRAAMLGRWVNVLITDRTSAEKLLASTQPAAAEKPRRGSRKE